MNHSLQCRCGTVRGRVLRTSDATRGVCYCKDCQAYAHWLGRAVDVLDAAGGTEIVALEPAQVVFSQGQDRLQCVTLTEKGPLRWYAGCCKTPIGNTARGAGTPYLGLVHSALSRTAPAIEQSFGPVKIMLNTGSALAKVDKTGPVATFWVMLGLMRRMLRARLNGSYRNNPFFHADGKPLSHPQRVVTAQRA
ncbi:MAG TPA: DUF6151 family protein [Rubrivivax sp.]|nr:DUF6151 family protein [Rubrivivax sp.]